MAERKQTPDVLAEILGGEVPMPDLGTPLPVGRITDLPPRPAKRAGTAKAEKTQPTPAQITAWEYEVVSFQNAHGWRPRFVNGQEVGNWMNGPSAHATINERSADGWELVAVASGQPMYGTSDLYQMYFRRPRSNHAK